TRGVEVPLAGPIDLTAAEVDLHLIDHGQSHAALTLADGRRVEVRGSPEYRRWLIWTRAGRDLICLEPWTCPANAPNTGQDLRWVPISARARWRCSARSCRC